MARILVHVEGYTERVFVREILGPHLLQLGHQCDPRLFGSGQHTSHRGGVPKWHSAKRDIVRHLREDASAFATTMVDYYGMPANDGGWPGRSTIAAFPQERAATVTQGMAEAVASEMGSSFDTRRFIPFVVIHEFDGLLFSDCDRFARSLGDERLTTEFSRIRSQFESPEHINDSPNTAPSKRILNVFPEYEKPLQGNLAMLEIGLDTVRAECPIFDRWIAALEAIPVE